MKQLSERKIMLKKGVNITEQREHNTHLANLYLGIRTELSVMLKDYFRKLEVDDYDPLSEEKMEAVADMLHKLEEV